MAVRAALVMVWLLSPAFLAILMLVRWKRTRHVRSQDKIDVSTVLGFAVVANWILFIVFLLKSQTPYGMVFQTSVLTHGLLLLSCFAAIASISVTPRRWHWLVANVLLITLWVTIGYSPAHWLKRWDYGSVNIDGHPTPASLYIGNPSDSEAEAIVLVHVPGLADYFLSFEEEKVRVATKHEYVPLPGGVWCFRSMRNMVFTDPLPSKQINEFRIASPNGVIAVKF